MSKVRCLQRPRKTQPREAVGSRPVGVWVRLPQTVVEARAGLIPSDETDGNPPPDGLTARELLAWHRGLPVFLSARRFVECLGTAKLSPWRSALPVVLQFAPAQCRCNGAQRAK